MLAGETLGACLPATCDAGLRAVAERCWAMGPTARPPMSEVLTLLEARAAELARLAAAAEAGGGSSRSAGGYDTL